MIDTGTLLCPACKSGNIQYCGGVYECCNCGVEGPELAFKAWRAPIPTDTLRKALEAAVKPLAWRAVAAGFIAVEEDGFPLVSQDLGGIDLEIAARTARILSTLDLDALAKALGGGE